MIKKLLALALVGPLLVSFSYKKGDSYNQARVNDNNRFDIFMGHFAQKKHKKF
ncbi:hypothetical protein ACVGW7_14835, partial [Enterobacter intestinihominis]